MKNVRKNMEEQMHKKWYLSDSGIIIDIHDCSAFWIERDKIIMCFHKDLGDIAINECETRIHAKQYIQDLFRLLE